MKIQLYNTLTRKKETFTPLEEGKVKIYSCGPTVYASPHIGNFRAFIFADLLRRSLEFLGYEVNHVMNITDVGHLVSDGNEGEDKLEKGAKREGISPLEIARKYEKEFFEDLAKLNIKKPTQTPRASEEIDSQIDLIKKLEAKGFTYSTSDGIYFDTSKFEDYGKLGKQKLEEKEMGKRIEVKSEKRNPQDFALWKFCVGENANHILRWDFESGKDLSQVSNTNNQHQHHVGFPGWHLECSAMSMKYLGETFDIHTGGVDHIPIHHENEIAQSEACSGKPFVKVWMHNEFLTVDGGKMSKSLGNLFTLEDLEKKGFEALAFRYLALNSHYRSKLNFTWEALENAQNSLRKLRETYQSLEKGKEDKEILKKFEEAISDDLNLPQALAFAWEFARSAKANQTTLKKMDEVLGLDLFSIPKELNLNPNQKQLIAERSEAKRYKNFERADFIRNQLQEEGLRIEDTSTSQIITSSNGDVVEIPLDN